LLDLVTRLTDAHEARLLARREARRERGGAEPWKVSDAPADYLDGMLDAIVGVELTLARLEGKWKASQNRSEADRRGVEDGLRRDEREEMARLVGGGTGS
jgi:transcriptional regulator